ncbi:MAG: flavin reductase, partial [Clostridiales bacterium]|nr:flavin reductase [Clostridiales bacterium]
RIRRAMGNARTGPGMRVMFYVVRKMMKGKTFSPVDRAHWAAQGWLGRGRPWRA